jgi:hypothetical protein
MNTSTADLGVVANGSTMQERILQTFYTGFGGWDWRGWNDGFATTYPETFTVGTLVVDLLDSRTKQAVVHELVHFKLASLPRSEASRSTEQYAVNRIAKALLGLDRKR